MTQKQLAELQKSGGTFCIGTYWAGKLDTITFRDKQSRDGSMRSAHVAREIIMTDSEPVAVTRFLKDNEPADAWKPAAKKGEQVVVKVVGMESKLGAITMQGQIEILVA